MLEYKRKSERNSLARCRKIFCAGSGFDDLSNPQLICGISFLQLHFPSSSPQRASPAGNMVFLSAHTQVYNSRGDCLVSAGTERGSSLQGHDGEADAEGGIPFPRPQVPNKSIWIPPCPISRFTSKILSSAYTPYVVATANPLAGPALRRHKEWRTVYERRNPTSRSSPQKKRIPKWGCLDKAKRRGLFGFR